MALFAKLKRQVEIIDALGKLGYDKEVVTKYPPHIIEWLIKTFNKKLPTRANKSKLNKVFKLAGEVYEYAMSINEMRLIYADNETYKAFRFVFSEDPPEKSDKELVNNLLEKKSIYDILVSFKTKIDDERPDTLLAGGYRMYAGNLYIKGIKQEYGYYNDGWSEEYLVNEDGVFKHECDCTTPGYRRTCESCHLFNKT